jgi:DNA-directed RNA polymerase II subunit RPB1
MNLTVPETVTSENIDQMRKLVYNGPNTWPGAKYIFHHDDKMIDLSELKNRSDAHLEPGYKVERHLCNNDYVIFNRQPSLHKMSLMGHRVKVLPF